ncbi:hypothetical protein U9068_24640 [Escherichia coli]|nr:hypothetical protein [Escherichia coli]
MHKSTQQVRTQGPIRHADCRQRKLADFLCTGGIIQGLISVAHQAFATTAGCGVNALSGLRVARESVGLISVAHQAFVTIAGCGVNALSGLRVAREL